MDKRFGADLERFAQGKTRKALPHLGLRGVKKEPFNPNFVQIVQETLENLERKPDFRGACIVYENSLKPHHTEVFGV